MKKDVKVINELPKFDFLSLFDEQFSINDIEEEFEKVDKESSEVMDTTRTAVYNSLSRQSDAEKYKFVVQMDTNVKKAIDTGEIKLVTNKDGEVFAQLRNSNGKFGSKLPIKKELEEQGVSADSLQLYLQMDLIKEQLKIMIDVIKTIESRVTEVLQGLRNDRIGLFYSGMSLYAESKMIRDEILKKQITSQALKSLSDANSQMIQDLRTSMEYLMTGQYKKEKKSLEKIEEHLGIIHQCYDVIYRSSFLKVAIYQQNCELPAMLVTLDEYGRFVEKMIVPYVGRLSELDKTIDLIDGGTWNMIANSLIGCKELKKKIELTNTYYIESKEE